jgi:WD40 repeat protein
MGADPVPGSEPVQSEPGHHDGVREISGSSRFQIGDENIMVNNPMIIVAPPKQADPVRRTVLIAALTLAAGGVSAWAVASGALNSGAPAPQGPGPGDATIPSIGVDPTAQAAVVLGSPLTGFGGTVYSVAFSPDGHTLASGSGDSTTRLWDVTNPARPALLGRPFGHDDTVFSVAFNPGGDILAVASGGTIRLWNVANPANPVAFGPSFIAAEGPIYSVAYSLDGNTLAAGGTDQAIWLWDVTSPRRPMALGDQAHEFRPRGRAPGWQFGLRLHGGVPPRRAGAGRRKRQRRRSAVEHDRPR